MDHALETLVRRVDEDRWLASRFADPPARARLIALYAVVYEIARTAEVVQEDMLGAIRLQWWRDGIAALYEGAQAPAHPALAALGPAIAEARLPRALFDAMIDAREADFLPTPFEGWGDLEAYVDATAGAVARLAAACCAPGFAPSPEQDALLRAAGRAWGLIGLVRAARVWRARGRTFVPKNLMAHVGMDASAAAGHAYEAALRAVLDRGVGALAEARAAAKALPTAVFPAVSYVALAAGYVKTLIRTPPADPEPARGLAMIARQLRLVGATASGAL